MLKQGKTKQQFKTGAQRDTTEGKSRPDLISPFANIREGNILRDGGLHYGDRNWEKGMPISRCVASATRHLMQYIMGDKSEDHMAQLRCNTGFILHYEEMLKLGRLPKELDDMPKYLQAPGTKPARVTGSKKTKGVEDARTI